MVQRLRAPSMVTRKFLPLAILAGLLAARPAHATFHLMQIEQAIGGVNGDLGAQAIQLRMRSSFQNLLGSSRVRAWDAAGQNPILIVDPTTSVPNSAAGARVLIASAGFSSKLSPSVTPDFTMTNLIPALYLCAGSLTFEDNVGTIYWRLSWGGARYTGSGAGSPTNDADGNFNPPFGSALPSCGTQAVQFKFGAAALSTNNANDYQLTSGAAVFTNNAGASGTVTGSDAVAPTVTITAPDGGEVWKVGSVHAITWTATDNACVASVDLTYSTDGGATFANVIATGLCNTGSHSWTVPNAPTTMARVRATARDGFGNTAADASNASFTIELYTITASAGPNGGISPSGTVSLAPGASQTFTITPDTGYHVADVLVDGVSVGAVTGYTFTNVNADHTISASFAVNTYALVVTVVGSGAVTKAPDQPAYDHGTVVQLTAAAAPGWAFQGWSGDASGTDNPLAVTMTSSRSITATFSDATPPTAQVVFPNGGETLVIGSTVDLTWTASDNISVTSVDLRLSRTGVAGPYDSLALGVANTGSFSWMVSGTATANAFLQVVAHDAAGNTGSDASDSAFSIAGPVGVEGGPVTEFELAPVQPNPLHGSGWIGFAVPRETRVRVSVLDVQGREVATLAEGLYPPGRYQLTWGGHSGRGSAKAGLYFVRLSAPGSTLVQRVVVVP